LFCWERKSWTMENERPDFFAPPCRVVSGMDVVEKIASQPFSKPRDAGICSLIQTAYSCHIEALIRQNTMVTMVTMVTMGGDLQPGCLADRTKYKISISTGARVTFLGRETFAWSCLSRTLLPLSYYLSELIGKQLHSKGER
jgi:hypothetical protein